MKERKKKREGGGEEKKQKEMRIDSRRNYLFGGMGKLALAAKWRVLN